jgi:hypothetical protein
MTPTKSKIEAAVFDITLECLNDGALPLYLGSTLRGAFGWSFKKIACALRREKCQGCILKSRCVYSYVFETPKEAVSADSGWWRRYPSVPHPFMIEPPERNTSTITKGEELAFRLILVGRARDYLPYFVCAFQEIGAQGLGAGRIKFDLLGITAVGPGHSKPVYEAKTQDLAGEYPVFRASDIAGAAKKRGAVKIRFITPALIKVGEQFSRRPAFKVLVRNLLRRLSALEKFHCGMEPKWDYAGLLKGAEAISIAESNLRWQEWQRYSNRQKQAVDMSGIVGEIIYQGDFNRFWELLKLGEMLHVGKGAVFGLGKYKIV